MKKTSNTNLPNRSIWFIIAVASCIVVIVIALFFMVNADSNPNGVEIYLRKIFRNDAPPKSYFAKSITTFRVSADPSMTWPPPPPHQEIARVARYLTHVSDWGSLATKSSHAPILDYPFSNIVSVCDGPIGKPTGIPYMYLTSLGLTAKDLKLDSRASLTLSEAQSSYCDQQGFDPEDPRCAHTILTGTVVKVVNETELDFARQSLFSRHPEMPEWPADHNWTIMKLNVTHIYILDFFGYVKEVDVKDYDDAKPFD